MVSSPFRTASITKTFTAALVLREVDKGTISLDDPLPAIKGLTTAVPTGLTVRRLLTHTSGLLGWGVDSGMDGAAALDWGLPLSGVWHASIKARCGLKAN